MELIIVILGISIAYQLNLVNEQRINNQLELNILRNLEKEVQINIAEFNSLKAYRKRITKSSRNLLRLLDQTNIRKDSAEKYIFSLVQTSTPDLQRQTTTSYLNSNYGSTNLDLKNELLSLQTFLQELMDLSESYKVMKKQDYMNYLKTEVDFFKRKIIRLEKIQSVEFKNIIWNMAADEFELNRLYEQATVQLSKVDSLMKAVISSYD
ncbi:hypothetical protein [Roseivirga sp.]|uniref:hypothetical protein n=1 Tax=Roseivirga sp. TaxID=1964215 RepID=UPI003B8DBE6F